MALYYISEKLMNKNENKKKNNNNNTNYYYLIILSIFHLLLKIWNYKKIHSIVFFFIYNLLFVKSIISISL